MIIKIDIDHHCASKRTRRIVKTAGPQFELLQRGVHSRRIGHILVRSLTTGWSGWLLLEELDAQTKIRVGLQSGCEQIFVLE